MLYSNRKKELDLRKAAAEGNLAEVQACLVNGDLNINAAGEQSGQTALHRAAQGTSISHYKIIIMLLEHGANPTLEDAAKKTPMQYLKTGYKANQFAIDQSANGFSSYHEAQAYMFKAYYEFYVSQHHLNCAEYCAPACNNRGEVRIFKRDQMDDALRFANENSDYSTCVHATMAT